MEVAGNRILACVQAMADVEVYQARTTAGGIVALKLARPDSDDGSRSICNESSILGTLQSDVAPRLVQAGLHEGRRFAAMEWRSGVDVALAAFELRGRGDASARLDLARLCVAVVAGYASLHEQGVIHGECTRATSWLTRTSA